MKIIILVKQAGKRRPIIGEQAMELSRSEDTLGRFINDVEIERWEQPIQLHDLGRVLFLKLTMLAGIRISCRMMR